MNLKLWGALCASIAFNFVLSKIVLKCYYIILYNVIYCYTILYNATTYSVYVYIYICLYVCSAQPFYALLCRILPIMKSVLPIVGMLVIMQLGGKSIRVLHDKPFEVTICVRPMQKWSKPDVL